MRSERARVKKQFCDHQRLAPRLKKSQIQMAQYIRPALRTHKGCHSEPRILSAAALDHILRPAAVYVAHVEREWVPSLEYELIALHMHGSVRAAYIEKSKAWFAANPPRVFARPREREPVNTEAVAAMIAKYGSHAPLSEYRNAGYSEAAVERVRIRRAWIADHDEELQAEIERRWPGSSSSKPKKVIKAVKKKMI
jgi:hypothetical protein